MGTRRKIKIVAEEVFGLSLIGYLILVIGEKLQPGLVYDYFNPDWLVLVILFSGVGLTLVRE